MKFYLVAVFVGAVHFAVSILVHDDGHLWRVFNSHKVS